MSVEVQAPPARLAAEPSPDFMKILKARVADTIGSAHLRARRGTYLKALVVLSWFLLSYLGIFFFRKGTLVPALLCISLGFANASLGFNVFHDSIHGALSPRPWVNRFWAFLSCSLLGASHFIWKHKHNFLHHRFPNVQNWDDDLETRGGLRLSPTQPWSRRYRFQHLYAPFIYGLTTIEWMFLRDFVRYFGAKLNETQKLPSMKWSDHLEFWASKLIYYGLTVLLPLQFFSPLKFLAGFLIVHFTTSVVLASIFQLAHVMEESQFPVLAPGSRKVNMNWGQLQLATTVNFAPSNRLLSWYCGGLNFQIEHHLLPGVCHCHYKKISKVVEATAREFGYAYHSIPTHRQALRNHYRMLRRFSTA